MIYLEYKDISLRSVVEVGGIRTKSVARSCDVYKLERVGWSRCALALTFHFLLYFGQASSKRVSFTIIINNRTVQYITVYER